MNPGRRAFLRAALRAGGTAALWRAAGPAIVRADAARPDVTYGAASGDVTGARGVVWSRTDRPARMRVDWALAESFRDARRVEGPVATAATGFTARVDLQDLPPSQRIVYRVTFEDLADSRNLSVPIAGSFLSAPQLLGAPRSLRPPTPPREARDLRFAWSADTCGQGWGINLEWGGLRAYETMRRLAPDFFLHLGDTIYADDPLPAERTLEDGSVWRNLVTPAKAKVAETLDELRGNHLYNLLDDNVRRFAAEVPQVVVWDDHEVLNNWYPRRSLEADPRYREKDVAKLVSRARQAFLEHVPIRLAGGGGPPTPIHRTIHYGPLLDVFVLDLRSYRAANSSNLQRSAGGAAALAGAAQLRWLQRELAASRATWKVIACSVPIGLLVPDGALIEGIANGQAGPPLGRELEIAALLASIQRRRIRNVVFLTADVHYAAAHHYDPARARLRAFDPFWEFVSGPLHAGVGRRLPLDDTFGPEVRFAAVPENGATPSGPPSGLQFFGTVEIAAASRVMTVRLHDLSGRTLHQTSLEPAVA